MTLRRYAPLALSALALACQPEIDERTNATTVEYAVFNPAVVPPLIPLPNDIALSQAAAFLPGGAAASVPCNLAGSAQNIGLCAYVRAGGFPAATPVTIDFYRGTMAGDGTVAYAPSPDAMDTATLAFAGASLAPTLGVIDLTALAPVTTATPSFTAASGRLTLAPPGGAWTAGHQYAVLVLGGDRGPTTLGGVPYAAMPPFYILREAVLGDLDLTDPANQGLFPGDAAEKAASGAALEPLRLGYRDLYVVGGDALTLLNLPFDQAASLQTFQVAPDATIAVDDLAASDPADFSVTGGGASPVLIDAFSLQSSVNIATLTSVVFALSGGHEGVATLSVNAASDCGAATTLGTSAAVGANGPVAIPFTHWVSVGNTASVTLYVCATTEAPAAPAAVSGGVAVSSANAVPGLVLVQSGTDTSAVLTVNP
jgi:hypothetical protein